MYHSQVSHSSQVLHFSVKGEAAVEWTTRPAPICFYDHPSRFRTPFFALSELAIEIPSHDARRQWHPQSSFKLVPFRQKAWLDKPTTMSQHDANSSNSATELQHRRDVVKLSTPPCIHSQSIGFPVPSQHISPPESQPVLQRPFDAILRNQMQTNNKVARVQVHSIVIGKHGLPGM